MTRLKILPAMFLPEPDYKISGKSFAGALTGIGYNPREWVYAQNEPDQYMFWTRDWKLLWDNRLYNMNTDIPEQNPILPDHDNPVSTRARTVLDSIRAIIEDKY